MSQLVSIDGFPGVSPPPESSEVLEVFPHHQGNVQPATAVIWKMLMLAERRFRRLDAPEKHVKRQKSNGKRYLLLPDIYTPIDKTSYISV